MLRLFMRKKPKDVDKMLAPFTIKMPQRLYDKIVDGEKTEQKKKETPSD